MVTPHSFCVVLQLFVMFFLSMKGDVQMSVSALLVLGERGTGLLEEKTVEQWFSSYIGEP